MTAATAVSLSTPAPAAKWLSVDAAARLMRCSERRIRQLCKAGFAQSFARLEDGAWLISPLADARLRDHRTLKQRDLEQLADLQAGRTCPEHIDIGKRKLAILVRWRDWDQRGDVHQAFQGFTAALQGEHVLPAPGIGRLSVSTLYRWDADYRAGGIAALVPKWSRCGQSGQKIGPDAWQYFKNLVLSGNASSVAACCVLTVGEIERRHKDQAGWEWAGYDLIRKRALREIPEALRVLANKGERAFAAQHVPKMERDFESIAAGEEYVADERTLDLWCRVLESRGWRAIRPKVTATMDIRSRMMVGLVLSRYANSRTILGSLKLAVAEYGKPRILRTDWGNDYKKAAQHGEFDAGDGERVGNILTALGIEVRATAAPYTPFAKPIESAFRGMKDHLDRTFGGFWGGCPSERHEDRAKYIRENLERLPTLDDVDAALRAYLEVYHRTPHSARDLFGKSPVEAMLAFRSEPARKESDVALDLLFQEFTKPKLVRRDGIRHNNRWYGNGDMRLVPMQGQKVLLAVQPENQGRALVCDLKRIPLFAVECQSLAGRTREEVAEMHRARHRLTQPYREQVKAARTFFHATTPRELLANRRAGIEALYGKREPDAAKADDQPSLTVVRPELEEAIAAAGPAPSEAASITTARTGTDQHSISVADLIEEDDRCLSGAGFAPAPETEDQISLEDLLGEL